MTKVTEGEWQFNEYEAWGHRWTEIELPDRTRIASTDVRNLSTEEDEAYTRDVANARLMAASKRLRDALRRLDAAFISRHGCFPIDRTNDQQKLWNDAMCEARAALAATESSDDD